MVEEKDYTDEDKAPQKTFNKIYSDPSPLIFNSIGINLPNALFSVIYNDHCIINYIITIFISSLIVT